MTKYFSILILLAIVILGMAAGVQAQDDTPHILYYMSADEDGIQQVYQLIIEGENEARQITYAESDVITFGAAYDGLSVTYVSDGYSHSTLKKRRR